jgi:hypothetical protein
MIARSGRYVITMAHSPSAHRPSPVAHVWIAHAPGAGKRYPANVDPMSVPCTSSSNTMAIPQLGRCAQLGGGPKGTRTSTTLYSRPIGIKSSHHHPTGIGIATGSRTSPSKMFSAYIIPSRLYRAPRGQRTAPTSIATIPNGQIGLRCGGSLSDDVTAIDITLSSAIILLL